MTGVWSRSLIKCGAPGARGGGSYTASYMAALSPHPRPWEWPLCIDPREDVNPYPPGTAAHLPGPLLRRLAVEVKLAEAIADMTHMTSVRKNSTKVSVGVMTIGKAVSAVAATTNKPMAAARQNPMRALISAWQMMTLWM